MSNRRFFSAHGGTRSFDIYDDTQSSGTGERQQRADAQGDTAREESSHEWDKFWGTRWRPRAVPEQSPDDRVSRESTNAFDDGLPEDLFREMDRMTSGFGFGIGSLMQGFGDDVFREMRGAVDGGSDAAVRTSQSYSFKSSSRVVGPDGQVREETVETTTGPDGVASTRRVVREPDGTETITVERGDNPNTTHGSSAELEYVTDALARVIGYPLIGEPGRGRWKELPPEPTFGGLFAQAPQATEAGDLANAPQPTAQTQSVRDSFGARARRFVESLWTGTQGHE